MLRTVYMKRGVKYHTATGGPTTPCGRKWRHELMGVAFTELPEECKCVQCARTVAWWGTHA
jgi:hypothetical protein